MLAEGYAFQYVGTENFVEYNKAATNQVNTISHVRVVKCPHAKVNEDGHCAYCNAAGLAALITTADGTQTAYGSFNEAWSAALQ